MNVRRVAWVMAAALPVVGALANGTHLLVHASGTADMSVGISAPSTVQWGEYFTYSVEISNTGPDTATGVVVTVNLPTDVAYRGSGSPSCSAAGQTVTCTFSSWGANAAGAFSISGQAMAIGTAVVQATITANESDPTLLDNTTSVTTTITPSTTADLLVTTSENPNPAYAGATLQYFVNFQNQGPGNATNTTVTDRLPAGLTLVPSLSNLTCSVDTSNVVTCTVGTVGVGTIGILLIGVQAQSAGTYTNTVSISSDQTDPTPIDNSATVTTRVLPSADLSVTNIASSNPVTAGHKLTFALTVTNNGPSLATGVSLADSWIVTSDIKGGVHFISVSSSQGTCSQSGSSVSCGLGDLVNASSATVTVVIQPRSKGTLSDTVTVSANERDPIPGDNSASTTVTVG